MRIFLDTEFLQASQGPLFLSAAFLTDVGDVLYSEMPLAEARDLLARHPNQFVLEHVLPQFSIKQGEPWAELPARLAAWLDSLGVQEADVVYDYSGDYLFVEQLIERMDTLPAVCLHPTHVGYLAEDVDWKLEAPTFWSAFMSVTGTGQHHALADANALRARFESVHGWRNGYPDDEPLPIGVPFELIATVTVVAREFELVYADTSDGRTLSLHPDTPGVEWSELREGQTLSCECIANPAVRVVTAKVISAAVPTDASGLPN